MKNLASFCRYLNENYVNKLPRSTTVVRFYSFVPSSILRAHCRARKATNAKYMNDKFRGEKKRKLRSDYILRSRVKHCIFIYDKVK